MNIAVILLSGKGTRLGSDTPKQFIMVNNRPIYIYSLHAFYTHRLINKIYLVTNKEYVESVKADLKKYGYIKKPVEVIAGGKERYLSVMNAIKELTKENYEPDDKILIHDGVRPNVSSRIIKENITGLDIEPCALTAIKAREDYEPRERLDTLHYLHNQKYRAQTPQSFKLGILQDIYRRGEKFVPFPFTDDISLAVAFDYPYIIVKGEAKNYKITRPEDLDKFIKEKKK